MPVPQECLADRVYLQSHKEVWSSLTRHQGQHKSPELVLDTVDEHTLDSIVVAAGGVTLLVYFVLSFSNRRTQFLIITTISVSQLLERLRVERDYMSHAHLTCTIISGASVNGH